MHKKLLMVVVAALAVAGTVTAMPTTWSGAAAPDADPYGSVASFAGAEGPSIRSFAGLRGEPVMPSLVGMAEESSLEGWSWGAANTELTGELVEAAEAGVPTPSTMALVMLAPMVAAVLTVRRRKRR